MTAVYSLLLLAVAWEGAIGLSCFRNGDHGHSKQKLAKGMEEFFSASNRFSVRLLQALNTTRDTFFSPFSVWSSLVLVYLGSAGTTERELEGVLRIQGMDKSVIAHSYQSIRPWFSSAIKSSSFTVANHLFLQKDIRVPPCLVHFIKSELAFTDFGRDPELARVAINFLIQRQTKDKIRGLLPPNSIRSFTEFVVTSTMHFEGKWLQPFPLHNTKPGLFFSSHFEYLLVDMMVTRDTFLYTVSEELQCAAIEMPYVGRSLTMVVLLPKNKAHGVQILASSLTVERLSNLSEDMFPREVLVALPKFQLEDSFQLSSTLLKMGLRDLGSGSVNLTGFSEDQRPFRVEAVYHKARISVDESGTEASAATATALPRRAHSNRVVDFVVDRPFVFFIRENLSKSVLFVGVVRQPKFSVSLDRAYAIRG